MSTFFVTLRLMDVSDKILGLLCNFLGDYGKESGEWYSFNCPSCAEEKMVDSDGKYNLEVTINPDERGGGGFHCWRCGEYNEMRGPLTKLFRRYADADTLSEFRKVLGDYRESRKYELPFIDGAGDEFGMDEIFLPMGFKPIRSDDPDALEAYEYVMGRGLDERIIKRYNLGYVGESGEVKSERNRVYFPSYDIFGSLNYWTGRDYTGKNRQKMKNAKVSKTEIVFNEYLVNWYEPVTLVEGPFDHVVTPNSIPLLGKTMEVDGLLYNTLVRRTRSLVRIFLDDDARKDALKIYSALNKTPLRGRLRIVDGTYGHDASDIYLDGGPRAILDTLCSARELTDYELAFI